MSDGVQYEHKTFVITFWLCHWFEVGGALLEKGSTTYAWRPGFRKLWDVFNYVFNYNE